MMTISQAAKVKELNVSINQLAGIKFWIGLVSALVALVAMTQVFMDIIRQKQGVIGILRVMGTPIRGVRTIMFVRALLVGALAVVFSGLSSWGLASMMNSIASDTVCRLSLGQMCPIWLAAVGCCLVGTYVPLLVVARQDPLDSIKTAAPQR